MAHTSDPSFLEGSGKRILSLRPVLGKDSETLSEKKKTKTRTKGLGALLK
jgi:hypothetical protein